MGSLSHVIAVLQDVVLHSRGHGEGEFDTLQRALRQFREDFRRVNDEDSALLLAESAIRALEEHSAVVERAAEARQQEMEAAIAMLSDLLLTIAHASEEQALELRESEQDISSVGQLHDPVAERTHLAECLEKIRAQVTRRNATGISRHARAEDEMYAGNSPRNLR